MIKFRGEIFFVISFFLFFGVEFDGLKDEKYIVIEFNKWKIVFYVGFVL